MANVPLDDIIAKHLSQRRQVQLLQCTLGVHTGFLTVKAVNSSRSQHKDVLVFLDEIESVKSPKGRGTDCPKLKEGKGLTEVAICC